MHMLEASYLFVLFFELLNLAEELFNGLSLYEKLLLVRKILCLYLFKEERLVVWVKMAMETRNRVTVIIRCFFVSQSQGLLPLLILQTLLILPYYLLRCHFQLCWTVGDDELLFVGL